MGHSVQPLGGAGMAGNKNQLPIFRAGLRPFEIVVHFRGLIVFINANERHVDVEAREVEVVGVAAKKGSLKLRDKYQPDITESLVAVKIVLASLIERDDVAA